jgi:hypothetical protein
MATAEKSKKDFKKIPEDISDNDLHGFWPPEGFNKKEYKTDIEFRITPVFTNAEVKAGHLVGIVARMNSDDYGPRPNMAGRNYVPPAVATHWYIGRLEDVVTTTSLIGEPSIKTTLKPFFGIGNDIVYALQEKIETKHKPKSLHDEFVAQLFNAVPEYMKRLGVEPAEGLKLPDGRIIARNYDKKE